MILRELYSKVELDLIIPKFFKLKSISTLYLILKYFIPILNIGITKKIQRILGILMDFSIFTKLYANFFILSVSKILGRRKVELSGKIRQSLDSIGGLVPFILQEVKDTSLQSNFSNVTMKALKIISILRMELSFMMKIIITMEHNDL